MSSARIKKKDRAGTQNTLKNQRIRKQNWLDLYWAELTAFFNITKYCIEEIY
jgi:hypothetical protein